MNSSNESSEDDSFEFPDEALHFNDELKDMLRQYVKHYEWEPSYFIEQYNNRDKTFRSTHTSYVPRCYLSMWSSKNAEKMQEEILTELVNIIKDKLLHYFQVNNFTVDKHSYTWKLIHIILIKNIMNYVLHPEESNKGDMIIRHNEPFIVFAIQIPYGFKLGELNLGIGSSELDLEFVNAQLSYNTQDKTYFLIEGIKFDLATRILYLNAEQKSFLDKLNKQIAFNVSKLEPRPKYSFQVGLVGKYNNINISHITKKHIKPFRPKLEALDKLPYCAECKKNFINVKARKQHQNSQKHQHIYIDFTFKIRDLTYNQYLMRRQCYYVIVSIEPSKKYYKI